MKIGDYAKTGDGTVVLIVQHRSKKSDYNPVASWSTKVIYSPADPTIQVGQYYELYETEDVKVVKPIFIEE